MGVLRRIRLVQRVRSAWARWPLPPHAFDPPGPGPRVRRRRRHPAVVVVGLVTLAWFVVAGTQLVRLRADAQAGRRAAEAAKGAARAPDDLLEGKPRPALRQAQRRFEAANRRAGSAVLSPSRVAPVVGRQIRAVDALTEAAAQVAAVGLDGLAEVRRALEEPIGVGEERIELVRQLAAIASRSERGLSGVDLGPGRALIGPVADAHQELATQVADLRRALRDARSVGTAMAELLQGPRRYLLLAANNAEMRAAAGMPLSVGELEVAEGRLRLGEMRPVTDLPVPDGAVLPTGDLAARWGWLSPGREWRNLLLSPRFDVSAPLAARMWEAVGGRPVDGVLLLDVPAMETVLSATGPIEVEGRRIDADNVVDELLIEQYLRLPTREERPERLEQLSTIAKVSMDAFDEGDWSASDLAGSLRDSARGRHVLAWSRIPAEQRAWRAAGVDGALGPDSLVVSVLNRGGNKLDRHLVVRADLRLRSTGSDAEGMLRLVLRNDAPVGAPYYIVGPHPDLPLPEGQYEGLVAVNLPGSATTGTIRDVAELAAAGPDGPTRVLATPVSIMRGEERTLLVPFTLAGGHGSLRVEPSARVPPIRWSSGARSWTDEEARTVRW